MRGRIPAGLLALLALALALRIGFDLARERPLRSDELDFERLAWNLARTGMYSEDGAPTAYRAIGYPAFVAMIYRAVGRHPSAVRVVQALLDTATTALLFLVLARRWRSAAWAAAWMWALYPPAIIYASLLVTETLFTVLLVAFLALSGIVAERTRSGAGLHGVLLGTLILIKPATAVYLLALPAVWALQRVPARRAVLFACGALIVIAPWLLRNVRLLGTATLTTSFGPNLLIGNHPGATGGYAPDVPPDMRPPRGRETDEDAASRRTAIRYIAQHPDRFLWNGFRKLAHLASSEGETVVYAFHENPADPQTRFRQKYRSLPVGLHLAVSLPYALIILSGVLGLAARPTDALGRAFLALLGVWAGIHFVIFGGSRFHFPLMPGFTLFAAELIAGGRERVRRVSVWRWALVLTTWALLFLVWASEIAIVAGA